MSAVPRPFSRGCLQCSGRKEVRGRCLGSYLFHRQRHAYAILFHKHDVRLTPKPSQNSREGTTFQCVEIHAEKFNPSGDGSKSVWGKYMYEKCLRIKMFRFVGQ